MKRRLRAWALLVSLALPPGCAPKLNQCLIPGQGPVTVTELFFGRDVPGRTPLSDAEWAEFQSSVIAREFPDGFTVLDVDGAWRDPRTRSPQYERSKILIVASAESDLPGRLERIGDTYRRRYKQSSVGVLTWSACGDFGN